MLCVWVHGCDPGRESDGSRLALYQTLSIECPTPIFFWHVLCVIVPFFLSFLSFFVFVLMLVLELYKCSSDIFKFQYLRGNFLDGNGITYFDLNGNGITQFLC